MQIWSPTPIASAPPDPPSPVMITIIFVFKLDKTLKFFAIASLIPLSSLSIPG